MAGMASMCRRADRRGGVRAAVLAAMLSAMAGPTQADEQARTQSYDVSGPGVVLAFPTHHGEMVHSVLRIEHLGSDRARGVRIYHDGADWTSLDRLAATITQGLESPEQKARAIWQFGRSYQYHWWPGDYGDSPHDPVTYFNAYGYGFCDDVASTTAVLLEAVGIPARMWHLGAMEHTVAEGFYDGQWHMFDADANVLLVESDGMTIAGVEDVLADPSLLAQAGVDARHLEDVFRRTTPLQSFNAASAYRPSDTVEWSLLPGDVVEFSAAPDDESLVAEPETQPRPMSVASGSLSSSVLVSEALARGWAQQGGSEGGAPGQPGAVEIVFPLRAPYPLLGFEVTASFGDQAGGLEAEVAVSRRGERVVWNFPELSAGLERQSPLWVSSSGVANYLEDGNVPAVHADGRSPTAEMVFRLFRGPLADQAPRVYADCFRFLEHDQVVVEGQAGDGSWRELGRAGQLGLSRLEVDLSPLFDEGNAEGTVRIRFEAPLWFWGAGLNALGFLGVLPVGEEYEPVPAPKIAEDGVLRVRHDPRSVGGQAAAPRGDYFVRLRVASSAGEPRLPSAISSVARFQVATAAVPVVRAGGSRIRIDSPEGQPLRVSAEWAQREPSEAPRVPLAPVSPPLGAVVADAEPLVFTWQPADDSDVAQYQVQVCPEPACVAPVHSGFTWFTSAYVGPGPDQIKGTIDDEFGWGGAPEWLPPGRSDLEPGRTYWWRVRQQSVRGIWGGWSEPWWFSLAQPEASPPRLTLSGSVTSRLIVADSDSLELEGGFDGPAPMAGMMWRTSRGETGEVVPGASWEARVPVRPGHNVVVLQAMDTAGRGATLELEVLGTATTRLLAEGATGTFFDEFVSIANPDPDPLSVRVRFDDLDGRSREVQVAVPPLEQRTIAVDELFPGPQAEVSASLSVPAGRPIVAQRTMSWDASGYGAHAGQAVVPDTRWHFAEGSQGYFDTYLLIGNASDAPVSCRVTFLLTDGREVVRQLALGARSRTTVFAGAIPELADRSFSIIVEAPTAIVAERAMYWGNARLWDGGHASAGVPTPVRRWQFAEGATGAYFDTYFLVLNPGDSSVTLDASYLLSNGSVVARRHQVPARSRYTIDVEQEDERLLDAAFGSVFEADAPVVVERSMYWPGDSGTWIEAHNSPGVTVEASRWSAAGGLVHRSGSAETYVLIANPSPEATRARVTVMREDGRPALVKEFSINGSSRFNCAVGFEFPELGDERVAVLVESLERRPVTVEMSVYWDAAGQKWASGTTARAVALPSPPPR